MKKVFVGGVRDGCCATEFNEIQINRIFESVTFQKEQEHDWGGGVTASVLPN